jgi:hypothetical protein
MKIKLTKDDVINWWLERYHNINLKGVAEAHPEWDTSDPKYDSIVFYTAYEVTQEQHDEWKQWFDNELPKILKIPKYSWKRSSPFLYLDCAPQIKKD